MGGKSARAGKHLCVCLALLILFLSGCSLLRDWREQRQVRDSMLQGHSLFVNGDYDGAFAKYREALVLAGDHTPADAAVYNIGLIYAHPNNPKRDNRKAMESFKKVMDEPRAYNNLGVALLGVGNAKVAAVCFEKAIELNPRYYEKASENLRQARQVLAQSAYGKNGSQPNDTVSCP